MSKIIQIDLDKLSPDYRKSIEREAQESGKSIDDVLLDILNRKSILRDFEQLREEMIPEAERQGLRSEEDVFRSAP